MTSNVEMAPPPGGARQATKQRTLSSNYALYETLGEGGTGVVFRATNRITRQEVALKQLRAHARAAHAPGGAPAPAESDTRLRTSASTGFDLRMTIAREFQTLASLHHPNVVRVFDYGFDDVCGPYFTMERLASPRDIVAASADKTFDEKVQLVVQLLRALVYLHRRNILHRDVKPSNVLVSGGCVKVLDFGFAMAKSTKHHAVGTVGYVAPEVLLGGAPSVAADLFAVGVVAYQMFTGRFPYDMTSGSSFLRGLLGRDIVEHEIEKTMVGLVYMSLGTHERESAPQMEPVRPLEGLGPSTDRLNAVVMKLLAPNPEHRYASAEQVIEDLGTALQTHFLVDTAETRESFLKAAEFVGRERELDQLLDALVDARDGEGSAWLVGGESGVGKSRLLEELRTIALVRNTQVLRACAMTEHALPYHLWAPLLGSLAIYVGVTGDEASVLKDIVPDIASVLDTTVADPPPLPAAMARERLYGVVERMLRRHTQPLVLLLEDLQWADADSLALLDHVSRRVGDLPVLVVANYREDERPDLRNALRDLRSIQLKRLTADGVRKLVGSMLGPAGESPELIEFLLQETEGNAFFLVEVLRALAEETTRLADIVKIERPEHILTGGMNQVVRRRLDRLPKSRLALLRLAAVAGRQIDLRVLQVASGEELSEDASNDPRGTGDLPGECRRAICTPAPARRPRQREVPAGPAPLCCGSRSTPGLGASDSSKDPASNMSGWLIACANAAVLETQDDVWRFAHDKLRERVLADLPAEETRRMHRTIAAAIESVYGASIEKQPALAYHYKRAGIHEKAAHYFVQSGNESARLFAVVDAREYYAHAVEELALLPDSEERRRQRVDTALKQVTVSWYSVAQARSLALLADADALLDSIDRARWSPADYGRAGSICLWQGRVTYVAGKTKEALEIFGRGLDRAKKSGDVQLELLLKSSIGQALFIKGHGRQALPYLQEAVDALAHTPDGTRVAGFYAMTRAQLGDFTEGLAMLEASLQRALELKYTTYIALQYAYPGVVYLLAEDWPQMLRDSRESARIALQANDVGVACIGVSFTEWAAIRLGDRAAADAAQEQFADLYQRVGGFTSDDWAPVIEIERALAFGTPEEAVAIAERVVARLKERGNLVGEILAHRAWARALCQMNRYEQADACLAESLRLSDAEGNMLMSSRTHVAWAESCKARGDLEGAERHLALAAKLLR